MGCCLSREDDRFNSGNEALLPKGRNSNKRVDVDLAKKEGANGTYKSPSAVVAAGDATPKVLAKPQLPQKAVENVDLLGLNDISPTPAIALKTPSGPNEEPVPSPTLKAEMPPNPVAIGSLPPKPATKEPLSSKPTESSRPKRAESSSPKDKTTSLKQTTNEEFMALSGKTEDGEGDYGGKAMDKSRESKPKKVISTKKSKKKRKKGKK